MEAFESDVERRGLRFGPAGVVRIVAAVRSGGVQAHGHTARADILAAAERCVPDHIVRAAHTEEDQDGRRNDRRNPIIGRAGRHQVRLGAAHEPAVLSRGPETAADHVLRRHDAVVRVGRVHVRPGNRGTPGDRRQRVPVVARPAHPVRRHVVRVRQFARRARVPVDVGLRTAVDFRPSGRRFAVGVLRLRAHVRQHESVPVRFVRRLVAERVPRFRRDLLADGRLRVFRRSGNARTEFPRNRELLHAFEQQEKNPSVNVLIFTRRFFEDYLRK